MSEANYEDLVEQAADLGHTPQAVGLLEEAVRLADAAGEVYGAYHTRSQLVEAAVFSGFHEKALVAFSWMLAQADRDPDEFDTPNLLWQYKWILGNVSHYPQIPRRRILDLLDDFERRLTRHGHGLRSAHNLRMQAAMGMGELVEAERRLRQWIACSRDALADCPACELNSHVELLADLERDDEALFKAAPILRGRLSCAEVPHDTYGNLMRPLLRLGRLDQAREHYKVGYRLVSHSRAFIDALAEHLLLLAHDANWTAAAELLEKHLLWAAETADLNARFRFYLASWLLLEKWPQSAVAPRDFHLAAAPPEAPKSATRNPTELAAWLRDETLHLASRFNQRNENDYYSQLIDKSRRLIAT
jgi:hypothetical protein